MIVKRALSHALAVLCAVLACLPPREAASQTWPLRPLRILVAYPPGGPSDDTARAIAERLAGSLGVAVLVENRAGAGGAVGMEALARAAPDGHTLGFAAISPLTLMPHLGSVAYDAEKDIAAVVSVMYSPVLLLATSGFAGDGFPDLIAAARKRPGQVRWATSGMATVGHLMLEQVRSGGQIDIAHIPYKGGAQQLTDALGGQFEIVSANATAALLEHVRAGKLRPLAVGAPSRLALLPQVPTLAELGMPQANLTSTFGFFAPGKTPEALVRRLKVEMNDVLRLADIRNRMLSGSNLPTGGSSAEFTRQIASESRDNLRVVRAAGIKAE